MNQRFIYDRAPMRVYWETTNACDLACRHCRAEAKSERDPAELTTEEGRRLFDQLASFGTPLPHVVLTGGDPLKRDDIFELVHIAREKGFGVSVAPSATPLLTPENVRKLREAGVDAISLSLDGATAEHHDAIRGIPGTYERTLAAGAVARQVGLPFQVNTLVCQETIDDLPAIYKHVCDMGAARWSLFFLVTVGRGSVLQPISRERAEELLGWVAQLAAQRMARPGKGGLVITTTEAPQLRRVVAEQKRAAHSTEGASLNGRPAEGPSGNSRPAESASGNGRPAVEPPINGANGAGPTGHAHGGSAHHGAGIRDGNGILFISNVGDICPSGFLEVPVGNVRRDDVVAVYREAPLFRELREPDHFGGRCGQCEYRFSCGGSRARAFSASGDPMAEDPLCPHEPSAAHEHAAHGIH
ncbi:MAG: radical SAM protein [Polyangiaceae bacterium]